MAEQNRAMSVAVVLKGYPRLSETFIAQELRELERAGIRLRLFSMRKPTDRKRHPVHDEITAPVVYLPEYLHDEPLRVFRAWRSARRRPGYRKALRCFLRDLRHDFTRNRIRRFGQALVLAVEMPEDIGWIYGHFIHTPASVCRYTHLLTGLPWSCSAHAKDIWTSRDGELAEKLASAAWTVTCTGAGYRHLSALAEDPAKVHLVYHGLDFDRFPSPEGTNPLRDGSEPGAAVEILTVGRAVAKKGLDTLVDALARVPRDLHWRWTHIGGGELSETLRRQVDQAGLGRRVRLLGAQSQETVLDAYRGADLFVLPSRIAANGDRDGLPNVLVEAASQSVACISTPVSGIVELIRDGENGLLVPPNDPDALANAMTDLIRNPSERTRLGLAAARTVHAQFNHRVTTGALVELFDASGVPRAASARTRTTEAA